MFAIPTKVIVGDEESPILTFYNDTIKEVTEETAVSPIGDELFIDQFVPIVKYRLLIQYIIAPADRVTYDGILSADGYVVSSRGNYDIRNIPYGTPVRFYVNGRINGLFYCDNVERQGKNLFKINCMSAIGLMNRQRSKVSIQASGSMLSSPKSSAANIVMKLSQMLLNFKFMAGCHIPHDGVICISCLLRTALQSQNQTQVECCSPS